MEDIHYTYTHNSYSFRCRPYCSHYWKNSMTSLDRMREGETVCMIYLLKMAKSLRLKSPLLHLVNMPDLITYYMRLHS